MDSYTSWQPQLRKYLMHAGLQGKTQAEIFKRFQRIPREDIIMELEALWAQEMVQRFTLTNRVIWRGTTNLNPV